MASHDWKEHVLETLKSYPRKKRQIQLLQFELDHPAHISEKELIESLSLSRAQAEGTGQSGGVSNKTLMIALQLQDTTERMNQEVVVQITRELNALRAELERIDYMVSLLSKEQAEVIQGFYFDEKSWSVLAKELFVSQRSLVKRRDTAITELIDIFGFVEQVKKGAGQ